MTSPRLRWAPKVPRALVFRVYRRAADGIFDDDAVDQLGMALLRRCRSILMVTGRDRADCPCCGALITARGAHFAPDDPLICPVCDFRTTSGQYRDSWRRRDLHGGNAIYAFERFVERYPCGRTGAEKLALVDRLIHAHHYSLRSDRAFRGVADNLLEGSRQEVAQLLDQISAGRAGADGGWSQADTDLRRSRAERQQWRASQSGRGSQTGEGSRSRVAAHGERPQLG